MISLYKEPDTKFFVAYGDVDLIATICLDNDGLFYPYIQHSYTRVAIKGGYRIPYEKYSKFMEDLYKTGMFADKITRVIY